MKIGELARAAEVNIDTVRFYERRGVLPRPDRLPSGYRVYTNATVRRLRLARALQTLGLTLDEIVDAMHTSDHGGASCETERWRLEAVLERLDAKINDLRRTRRDVVEVLAECAAGRCRFAGPEPIVLTTAYPERSGARRRGHHLGAPSAKPRTKSAPPPGGRQMDGDDERLLRDTASVRIGPTEHLPRHSTGSLGRSS